MLLDTIRGQVSESVKKGETERVETLRFLIAAIQNFAISKYGANWSKSLVDTDVLEVIRKQVKSHKESVAAFESAGRLELVQKEKKQLIILESYLPLELSDEELEKALEPIIDSGNENFGLLMKDAMVSLKGKADGARVSAKLRELLQNKVK